MQDPQALPGVHGCGEHVQEPSAGMHTQLSLPPLVQLQVPELHAAITALKHAALDLPERLVAATSSEHAVRPQGGVESALEPASVRAAPRASTPSTRSTFLVAISTLLAWGLSSDRASRARDPLSGTPRIAWRGQVRLKPTFPR